MNRSGVVEIVSGLRGYRLLRLGGSAFQGFVRDQYTTLPSVKDRPLYVVPTEKREQIRKLKALLKQADLLYLAG